jgi:hypothetical protein
MPPRHRQETAVAVKGMPPAIVQGKHEDDGHRQDENGDRYHSLYSIQLVGLPHKDSLSVTRTRDCLFWITAIHSFTIVSLNFSSVPTVPIKGCLSSYSVSACQGSVGVTY